MRAACRWTLGCSALAGALIAGPVDAQRVAPERLARGLAAGEQAARQLQTPTGVTTERLYLTGGVVSAGGAVGLAHIGWYIDVQVCDARTDDDGLSGLGCLFDAGPATKSLWILGGALGATLWSVRAAQGRGCPARTAWNRAMRGALLGAAPGAIAAANGPGTAPALVWLTPLLSGMGAATAVAGCRGQRHTDAEG